MMKKTVLALCATTVICSAGCAQIGHPFDPSLVNQLTSGASTEADAIALLGTPTTVETSGTGNRALQWTHIASSALGAHGESVILIFGPDHRMLRVGAVTAVN
jgi:hypothetical protein